MRTTMGNIKNIFVFICAFLVKNITGATYYVATDGDNGNSGSLDQPWKTLAYTESQLVDGDVVFVRGGMYHEMFTINVLNVTFKNYSGEFPIIDGQWSLPVASNVYTSYDAMVEIIETNVVFDGFEIKNAIGTELKFCGVGHDDVIVRNCIIHDVYRFCLQPSHNVDGILIENCDIYQGTGQLVPRQSFTRQLFLKWIKQHLRIKKFYGTNFNAVCTQIWIAVSINLLVAIIKKRLKLKQELYTILQIFSISLFEKVPLDQLFSESDYRNSYKDNITN